MFYCLLCSKRGHSDDKFGFRPVDKTLEFELSNESHSAAAAYPVPIPNLEHFACSVLGQLHPENGRTTIFVLIKAPRSQLSEDEADWAILPCDIYIN